MIFGGTAVQTMILSFITMRCDWEKEVDLIFFGFGLSLFSKFENLLITFSYMFYKIYRRRKQVLVLTNGPTQ